MRLPISWLNEFVDVSDIPVTELAERLTRSGLQVEAIETSGPAPLSDAFVVGEVLTCEVIEGTHLHKTTVSDGTATVQVVCGAPNCRVGLKSVLAKIGAVVPDGGFKIKKGKLRGVESLGMLCSSKELALAGGTHEGIIELPADAPVGAFARDVLGGEKPETVFEIEVTWNRPDALSVMGLAREFSAVLGRPMKMPAVDFTEGDVDVHDEVKVEVRDPVRCPRYTARVVTQVKDGPSPAFMAKRLEACGVRSLGLLVDVTNYVTVVQGTHHAVQRLDRLARRRVAHHDPAARERLVVEGVHRLPAFEHHVVRPADARVQPLNADVALDFERARRLIGIPVENERMVELLASLGLTPREAGPYAGKASVAFGIPSWRWDLSVEADLVEEVARLYGLDNIPDTMPSAPSVSPWRVALRPSEPINCGSSESRSTPYSALTGSGNVEEALLWMKGAVARLAETLHVARLEFRPAEHPAFAAALDVRAYGRPFGVLGVLSAKLRHPFRLTTQMALAELDLEPLTRRFDAVGKVTLVPAFPMVKRDIAFVAGSGVTHEAVEKCIRKAAPPELTAVTLFDIFTSKDIGKGRRSFAYSLAFRSADRTLTDDEVNRAFAKIVEALRASLGVEVRDN